MLVCTGFLHVSISLITIRNNNIQYLYCAFSIKIIKCALQTLQFDEKLSEKMLFEHNWAQS